MKIKKGDTVQVIAGKDKGAKGKVIQAYPDTQRVPDHPEPARRAVRRDHHHRGSHPRFERDAGRW